MEVKKVTRKELMEVGGPGTMAYSDLEAGIVYVPFHTNTKSMVHEIYHMTKGGPYNTVDSVVQEELEADLFATERTDRPFGWYHVLHAGYSALDFGYSPSTIMGALSRSLGKLDYEFPKEARGYIWTNLLRRREKLKGKR